MKIAVITDIYPYENEQIGVFVEQLVETMIDKGTDVTVIAPQSLTNCIVWRKKILPLKNNGRTRNGNNYRIYRPKYISFGNCGKQLHKLVFKSKGHSILSILKEDKYDVIYCHFWEQALYVANYCKKNKLPLFVACGEGDNALETMVERYSPSFINELKRIVTGVISVSTENKRKCIEYNLANEEDIIVLPNCVNTELFRPKDATEIKQKLNIKEDDFVISFVGGFIERKGSVRLANAIDQINDKSIKSIFIGRTLSTDKAVPDCKGIIHRGPLDHSIIPDYLNCSDVFVLPTQNEGCSNAIVEALACGLPVISSVGAFNDDILTEENSIRIDPNDVDQIAKAILTIKNNPEIKNRLKRQIQKENPYSLNARADKIMVYIDKKYKSNENI